MNNKINNLLIYGSIEDIHLLRVSKYLLTLKINSYFIDPLDLGDMSIRIGCKSSINNKIYAYQYPTMELALVDISTCLFWRRNKRMELFVKDEMSRNRFYAIKEMDNFIDGLIYSNALVELSSTIDRTRHEHKLYQLTLAKEIGFNIPDTIISNDKQDIREFVSGYEHCIIKALKNSFWEPTRTDNLSVVSILVNRLTLQEIDEAGAQSFSSMPMIIQSEVEKRYEVRLVAFNGMAVAYKVNSQDTPFGKVDSRRGNRYATFTPIEVPSKTLSQINSYLNAAGISYGVFDFAVDKNDEYVFFECNSDGQWAYLEKNNESCLIAPMFAKQIRNRLEV